MTEEKKRQQYTKLTIDEISGVDRPAQEGAVAVALFKRAENGTPAPKPTDGATQPGMVTVRSGQLSITQKGYVADESALTTAVDSHTHLLDLSAESGYTSWEGVDEHSHAHPYVMRDGVPVIGEADGHIHESGAEASKSAGDGKNGNGEPMPENTNTPAGDEKSAERIAELEKSLAESKALASMTDAQKAHHATLEGDAAGEFLAAEPTAREAAVEAAKSADAVVYVSKSDGAEYRASDDTRLVALAKRADVDAEKLRASEEAREVDTYKARAREEIPHLAGSADVHVAILKAIDGIADEDLRGKALESIKSNDAAVGDTFDRNGSNGEDPDAGTPGSQLNAMTKRYMAEHNVTEPRAYAEVTKTKEGAVLLQKTIDESMSAKA